MTSDSGRKKFDCVKWTRETRNRLSRKMATMTWEEIAQWLDGEAEKDPSFSQLPKSGPPRLQSPAGTGLPRAGRP